MKKNGLKFLLVATMGIVLQFGGCVNNLALEFRDGALNGWNAFWVDTTYDALTNSGIPGLGG